MSKKHPGWTRTRVGRNRIHWVAYDDQPGSEGCRIVDQGDAISLVEADAAARTALATEGIYQARRISKGFGPTAPRDRSKARTADRPEVARPRQYLYTRHQDGQDDRPFVAAHLVVKKTARRVYVSRKSWGPDQLGTDDEKWDPNEPTIPINREQIERDGSVYARSYRQSEFYSTREAALGDFADHSRTAFNDLGIRPPCTIDEIKAAYRLKAFAAHPDRGGTPDQFRAVEASYRRLLREAQAPEA